MVFKLLAALMFSTAGAIIGISGSERLKQNRDICRAIGEMLRVSAMRLFSISVKTKIGKTTGSSIFIPFLSAKSFI